ncbi:nucleotidyltransferase domain-containing protein [Microaerobacter geothermalis]|uniref:nucleotidyltransferase family protein n=1 Tax=Microaerobacter geothermalis TaxID=674972 RepID=UPI001F280774|nr:nucleotidyltransferase domain-containing protein [Microaerobacter geothermalis]MCF6093277.1 nucleotidyltransferase domain-containing protein [Microaerobacter geothermalis]
MMRFGLEDKIMEKIISIFSRYKAVQKAVIFGSRARGDFKYNSDIDIAVLTNGEPVTGLLHDLDEAAGIYKTNLIILDKLNNERLRQNIERDGIEIYRI